MMIILKLFLLLLTSTVVADFPAPLDVVDLDLPPRERWVPAYKNALKRHGSWEYTGAPVFEFLNNSIFCILFISIISVELHSLS